MNYETLALSTLLFMVYFSCFSIMITEKATTTTTNTTSTTNYSQYKEAFSAAYDPEPIIDPELTNQVTTVANEVITTPTTTENNQPRQRRLSRVATVVNEVIITPPPTTTSQLNPENKQKQTTAEDNVQPEKPELSITEQNRMLCLFDMPDNPSIRQLRQLIKQHNLQTFVKNKLGKSVSQCRKDELIQALGVV